MIQSLSLQNFQSHKRTELILDPGVNVVVGPSDSGKSALLRALGWAAFNRPSGEAFRSSWGGDTEVRLDVNKQLWVSRSRTKKDNGYTLFEGHPRADFQEQHLKAVGQDVPEGVSRALGLTELNIQRQLDAPFLLSESSAEVARVLNRVVRLDEIDSATSKVNSRLRSATSAQRNWEALAEQCKENLQEFQTLGKAEELLTGLEVLEANRTRLHANSIQLTTLVKDIVALKEKLARLPDVSQAEEKLEKVKALVVLKEQLQTQHQRLRNAVGQIVKAKEEVEDLTDKALNLEKRWRDEFPDVCPLCGERRKKPDGKAA